MPPTASEGDNTVIVYNYVAKIDPLADSSIAPWFITFGLGGPAAGSYTEVIFDASAEQIETHVLGGIIREVANELYASRWAFHYPPDDYESVIEQRGLWRRERVVVSNIVMWSS